MSLRMILMLVVSLVVVTVSAQGTEEASGTTHVYTFPDEDVVPEGIAYDPATGYFYVGSTADGTVYRGRLDDDNEELEIFLAGGSDGRDAVTGMKVDAYGRLWSAGRRSGRIYVYDTETRDHIRTYETPEADSTLINDIALTGDAAYITDSFRPVIFRVPYSEAVVGDLESWVNLEDSPIRYQSGFNLNGIVASAEGQYLLTVQSNTGNLFRIDLNDQTIVPVELTGGSLRTGDGLWLEGNTLYVVRNSPSEVAVLTLSDDYIRASAQEPILDERFNSPTTMAIANNRLLVVNFQRDEILPGSPFTVVSVPRPSSLPE